MSTIQVQTEISFDELLNAVKQLNSSDLEQLMVQVRALQAQRRASSLPKAETELLLKINQGLPPEKQQRFNELVAKRQAETLTAEEHQELLQLTNDLEKSDAKRVQYLTELAQFRGTSLSALMKDLGIGPPADA